MTVADPANLRPPKTARRTRAVSKVLAVRLADAAGLMDQGKTRHINAKVAPALFEAAAKRAGSHSPAVVIEAALAALATQDDIGPWLVSQWGSLADVDPQILSDIEF